MCPRSFGVPSGKWHSTGRQVAGAVVYEGREECQQVVAQSIEQLQLERAVFDHLTAVLIICAVELGERRGDHAHPKAGTGRMG